MISFICKLQNVFESLFYRHSLKPWSQVKLREINALTQSLARRAVNAKEVQWDHYLEVERDAASCQVHSFPPEVCSC